jgi:hypothetical protein
MDTPQQHRGGLEEPERREGLGGRVRRFVDTEFSRVRDKDNLKAQTPTEHPGKPDPGGRAEIADRAQDSRPAPETRAHEPHRTDEPDQPRDPEPVVAHTGGDINLPVRTSSSDAGREPGLAATGAGELPGRSEGQAAADEGAARVGLLTNAAGLRDEWQRVQGTFVDDPQRAVREASVLVERTLDEIRVNVTTGHTSGTTSTEELRVSFQRYREFFQRLLSA